MQLSVHVLVLDLPLFKKFFKKLQVSTIYKQTKYNDKHVYTVLW